MGRRHDFLSQTQRIDHSWHSKQREQHRYVSFPCVPSFMGQHRGAQVDVTHRGALCYSYRALSLGNPPLSPPTTTTLIVRNKQACSLPGRCSFIPQSCWWENTTVRNGWKAHGRPWLCTLSTLSDKSQGCSGPMVDCLAQKRLALISACHNSIHSPETLHSESFPSLPATRTVPFGFLYIHLSLLCPELPLHYQTSANTVRAGAGAPYSCIPQLNCSHPAGA